MNARAAVLLLATLVVCLGTARLGWWQLDRAAQKNALQSALDARRSLPPLPVAQLSLNATEAAAQHHRSLRVTGQWLPAATIYLDNRQMHGRPGFFVVTPLQLEDGSALIVQRGWLARDMLDRSKVTAPDLPDGPVSLLGRIAPPPARLYEFDSAASGPIRQNLVLDAFAQETRLKLRPLSLLQLDEPATARDGVLRDWPQPAADVHKHYGYAFQWFALSLLTLGLYVWFQFVRPALGRRSRA